MTPEEAHAWLDRELQHIAGCPPHDWTRFGVCPVCGETDGYVNIEADHYFVCDTHRTMWYVGRNLFSAWREETEQEWSYNSVLLEGMREVEAAERCDRCGLVVSAEEFERQQAQERR